MMNMKTIQLISYFDIGVIYDLYKIARMDAETTTSTREI